MLTSKMCVYEEKEEKGKVPMTAHEYSNKCFSFRSKISIKGKFIVNVA